MRKTFLFFVTCLMTMILSGGVLAQDSWDTVMRDRNRQVQIDRSSIIPSDGGARVAWARVVLTPDEASRAGYAIVQALNRYDCANRSFTTVKRRYLDQRNIVLREESPSEPESVPVSRHSVDERLWREVCRPPSMSDLERIADEAGRIVESMTVIDSQARPLDAR